MRHEIERIAHKRGYYVTKGGDLVNPKGKVIGYTHPNGYTITNIRVNGKKVTFRAHRLQAYQKYGEVIFDDKIVARHKDGNPANNSWDNILIGTHSQNMMDKPKKERIKHAKHASSFLKKYDNEKVKEYHEKSQSYKKTMNKFDISSKGTLHYILNQ